MIPFTIALPGGRLAEESIRFFQKSGIAEFEFASIDRELSFFDTKNEYRIILVRSQDVPTYVVDAGVDAGITGRDILAEKGYRETVPLELGFGRCRLAVAAPVDTASTILNKPHLRVATKYPNLAMDYFFRKGLSCEVIKIHGAVEIAPYLGLADCIVDLVSTGATLKANGLVELETILESSAMLLVNRSAYALQTERINRIITKFRAQLAV